MRNPFLALDEFVLEQFDKLTQKAHKKFGWDKYDLAHVAETASAVAFTGYGCMENIRHYLRTGQISSSGIFGIALGAGLYWASKRKNEQERRKELDELMRTAAVRLPERRIFRPVMLIGAAAVTTSFFDAAYQTSTSTLGEQQLRDPTIKAQFMAWTLSIAYMSLYMTTQIVGDYFENTTMTPPVTKRGVFRTVYTDVREWVNRKTRPVVAQEVQSSYVV